MDSRRRYPHPALFPVCGGMLYFPGGDKAKIPALPAKILCTSGP